MVGNFYRIKMRNWWHIATMIKSINLNVKYLKQVSNLSCFLSWLLGSKCLSNPTKKYKWKPVTTLEGQVSSKHIKTKKKSSSRPLEKHLLNKQLLKSFWTTSSTLIHVTERLDRTDACLKSILRLSVEKGQVYRKYES